MGNGCLRAQTGPRHLQSRGGGAFLKEATWEPQKFSYNLHSPLEHTPKVPAPPPHTLHPPPKETREGRGEGGVEVSWEGKPARGGGAATQYPGADTHTDTQRCHLPSPKTYRSPSPGREFSKLHFTSTRETPGSGVRGGRRLAERESFGPSAQRVLPSALHHVRNPGRHRAGS